MFSYKEGELLESSHPNKFMMFSLHIRDAFKKTENKKKDVVPLSPALNLLSIGALGHKKWDILL